MQYKSRLFIFIVMTMLFVWGVSFASAPKKDSRPVKAKVDVNPTPSTTPPIIESAPKPEPIPQSSPQPLLVPHVQPPIADPFLVESLSSSAVGEQIKWQVISGGGSQGASASYKLGSTIGQTAAGPGTSLSYKLNAGFWQNFSNGCCVKEGDCNHNNTVNIVDVTFLVAFLFQSGTIYSCKEEADVDDNNSVNVVDLTKIVAFLFQGGLVGVCP